MAHTKLHNKPTKASALCWKNRSHVEKVCRFIKQNLQTWGEQVPSKKHSRNQRILACELPETPFEPAYIFQLLFPSDLAMEKREESNKRNDWEWKSVTETAAGKWGIELPKFLILC